MIGNEEDTVWAHPVKDGCVQVESGKNNLTKHVLKMGLDELVVDKEGKAYKKVEWNVYETFRRDDQNNLLIADNQIDMYSSVDSKMKRILSRRTWGDKTNDCTCEGATSHDNG